MANAVQEIINMLRLKVVLVRTGFSRSTIYLRIHEGTFPRPVNLGARAVAWPSNEVDAINAARIAGKTEAEVRELVATMEAARKSSK